MPLSEHPQFALGPVLRYTAPMNTHVPKVGLVSLGCPKALVDSERILTQLRAEGYKIAPGYDKADVVIVNTCGFLDSAKRESLAAIGTDWSAPRLGSIRRAADRGRRRSNRPSGRSLPNSRN